jgi:hypothetical protein
VAIIEGWAQRRAGQAGARLATTSAHDGGDGDCPGAAPASHMAEHSGRGGRSGRGGHMAAGPSGMCTGARAVCSVLRRKGRRTGRAGSWHHAAITPRRSSARLRSVPGRHAVVTRRKLDAFLRRGPGRHAIVTRGGLDGLLRPVPGRHGTVSARTPDGLLRPVQGRHAMSSRKRFARLVRRSPGRHAMHAPRARSPQRSVLGAFKGLTRSQAPRRALTPS